MHAREVGLRPAFASRVRQLAAGFGLLVWGLLLMGSVFVLRPVFIGGGAKMSDLVILISTLGGLKLFGMVGVVIGPLIAALLDTAWAVFGVAFEDFLDAAPARLVRGASMDGGAAYEPLRDLSEP